MREASTLSLSNSSLNRFSPGRKSKTDRQRPHGVSLLDTAGASDRSGFPRVIGHNMSTGRVPQDLATNCVSAGTQFVTSFKLSTKLKCSRQSSAETSVMYPHGSARRVPRVSRALAGTLSLCCRRRVICHPAIVTAAVMVFFVFPCRGLGGIFRRGHRITGNCFHVTGLCPKWRIMLALALNILALCLHNNAGDKTNYARNYTGQNDSRPSTYVYIS